MNRATGELTEMLITPPEMKVELWAPSRGHQPWVSPCTERLSEHESKQSRADVKSDEGDGEMDFKIYLFSVCVCELVP